MNSVLAVQTMYQDREGSTTHMLMRL